MRGLFTTIQNLKLDARQAFSRHFFNGIGGSEMSGVYILIPFTRLSVWIEWRELSVGLGLERGPSQLEFFAGRLQGVFCIEPATAR